MCLLFLFNPSLDFLHAVEVTKSGHDLLQDRASKGCGSIPDLTTQTSLHAWLQRLTMMPLTSSVVQQMMARFRTFYSV